MRSKIAGSPVRPEYDSAVVPTLSHVPQHLLGDPLHTCSFERYGMRDVDVCTPITSNQNWLTDITCCISQEAVVRRTLVLWSPLIWSSGSMRKVWSSACHAMFTPALARRLRPVVSHKFADRCRPSRSSPSSRSPFHKTCSH